MFIQIFPYIILIFVFDYGLSYIGIYRDLWYFPCLSKKIVLIFGFDYGLA